MEITLRPRGQYEWNESPLGPDVVFILKRIPRRKVAQLQDDEMDISADGGVKLKGMFGAQFRLIEEAYVGVRGLEYQGKPFKPTTEQLFDIECDGLIAKLANHIRKANDFTLDYEVGNEQESPFEPSSTETSEASTSEAAS